jgi:hypothetical protein
MTDKEIARPRIVDRGVFQAELDALPREGAHARG